MMFSCRFAVCLLAAVLGPLAAISAEISIEQSEAGARVKIDGQLFTEYHTVSGTKPILWPIIGPTGKPVTRDFPMADKPGEAKDHPHQRSCWFSHGNVNGVSFWEEKAKKPAKIEHREFLAIESGNRPTIATRNDWIAPDGRKLCEDRRTLGFGATADARWIDFEIVIRASEGELRFGDTKEGSFGLRVAESIAVDARQGGRIVNSEGKTNREAWGRRAAWVDYCGPLEGQTVGIAVMNHPSSFRYPTYWHVRTYGLFAANPFGVKEFGGEGPGDATLAAGETICLRYRVYLHTGDERSARVAEVFQEYSAKAF